MFFRHATGTHPQTGLCFETRPQALDGLTPGYIVTFVANEEERAIWTNRELDRIAEGQYHPVPWTIVPSRVAHYAHISTGNANLIAYTPDDVFGVEDRQLRVKPGKYLTQFYGDVYTPEEIVVWSDRVKAMSLDMHIATTPEECESVYTSLHGPDSCMSGKGDWAAGKHPATVYGGFDTAVAYIGHIGGPHSNHNITARAVIRTDRKLFYRAYGVASGVLVAMLLAAGYTQTTDALQGARVRAVSLDAYYWLMPYIDGVGTGTLNPDGQYFTLGTDGGVSVHDVTGRIHK